MSQSIDKITLIKMLDKYHPAEIAKVNPKLAKYTGGMADSGDLNWRYILYKATTEELVQAINHLQEKEKK